jgi:hypothetical protein
MLLIPSFPLLISDAFEVFECELDGEFRYQPGRETDPSGCEKFWCLKVKNILLKESFTNGCWPRRSFPAFRCPTDSGTTRPATGGSFSVHTIRPKPVPIPVTEGLKANSIYYTANKLDPEVRFELEACQLLVDAPTGAAHGGPARHHPRGKEAGRDHGRCGVCPPGQREAQGVDGVAGFMQPNR